MFFVFLFCLSIWPGRADLNFMLLLLLCPGMRYVVGSWGGLSVILDLGLAASCARVLFTFIVGSCKIGVRMSVDLGLEVVSSHA